jgi:hypothetical protein
VSTQVYTNSLMEDISARKRDERALKERIGQLTTGYVSLASRSRVSSYCENKLDMVEADAAQVIRVSLDDDDDIARAREFSEGPVRIPEILGSDIGELTRVMRR